MNITLAKAPDESSDQEQKLAALGFLQEAWREARISGVDGDCLAQASLFVALAEFVTTYGEEAAARFAEGLPQRLRNGEFSLLLTRQ
jgi:hypothetical protein